MRTTIYLTDELHKSLKMWAVEHGQTMQEVITMALRVAMTMVEVGRDAPETPKTKEMARKLKKDIDETFPDSLNKKRGEIHGEDYI